MNREAFALSGVTLWFKTTSGWRRMPMGPTWLLQRQGRQGLVWELGSMVFSGVLGLLQEPRYVVHSWGGPGFFAPPVDGKWYVVCQYGQRMASLACVLAKDTAGTSGTYVKLIVRRYHPIRGGIPFWRVGSSISDADLARLGILN